MMSEKEAGQSGGSPQVGGATVSDIQELIRRKEEIEAQIKANYEVLESQKGIGMNEPLVDCEGYPRSDVDLYQVRTARHNIVWSPRPCARQEERRKKTGRTRDLMPPAPLHLRICPSSPTPAPCISFCFPLIGSSAFKKHWECLP
uniref:Proteasome 26S subunit, non-ATPase 9 n=1 Tax=Equus asinus TaxID=9793 RepID=A0A9L0J391_EQUAS